MRFLRFILVVVLLSVLSLLFTKCANDDDATAPIVDFKGGMTDIQLGQGTTTYTISALIISEVSRLSQVRILSIDEFGVKEQLGLTLTNFDDTTYKLEVPVAVKAGVNLFEVEAINLDAAMTVGAIKVTVAGPIPLSTIATFTLGYPGSSENPKAQYGITYELNYKEKPEARFLGRFAIISQSEYTAITSRQLMTGAYESGTKVDRFDAKLDADFQTIYFVVLDGSTYHLIEMTSLTSSGGGENINGIARFNERH